MRRGQEVPGRGHTETDSCRIYQETVDQTVKVSKRKARVKKEVKKPVTGLVEKKTTLRPEGTSEAVPRKPVKK